MGALEQITLTLEREKKALMWERDQLHEETEQARAATAVAEAKTVEKKAADQMIAEVAALQKDKEEATSSVANLRSQVNDLRAQVEDLWAQNDNLQNNLQDSVQEAEEAKKNVVAEQDALGNYVYVCAAGDYIQAVQHIDPSFNLTSLFEELIAFMTENPLGDDPLPLLNLVEFGYVFPDGFVIVDKIEAPTK